MTVPLRAFALRGADAVAALDWLHVHAEPLGVLEGADAIVVWLDGALPRLPFRDLAVEELPEDEANASSTGLERDAAILVAPDLLVRPPWVARPAGFAGLELVVPRGMAFGSGEHDSTKVALRALHAVWATPATFADVGTGSGILAAYAALRGTARIAACDIEQAAVLAARDLVPTATVRLGGPEVLPFAADFVVANLTADELHAALDGLLAAWTGRAPLVLAGTRHHEVEAIRRRVPATVVHTETGDQFCASVFAPAGFAPSMRPAGRR